jgi:hypothetical protein
MPIQMDHRKARDAAKLGRQGRLAGAGTPEDQNLLHAASNQLVGLAPVLAQQWSATGKGRLVIFRRPRTRDYSVAALNCHSAGLKVR